MIECWVTTETISYTVHLIFTRTASSFIPVVSIPRSSHFCYAVSMRVSSKLSMGSNAKSISSNEMRYDSSTTICKYAISLQQVGFRMCLGVVVKFSAARSFRDGSDIPEIGASLHSRPRALRVIHQGPSYITEGNALYSHNFAILRI